MELAGERLDKREDAETLLRIVNSDDFAFSIFKAERKQQHDAPPRLYDLTGLQKDMSRLHGLTAARTCPPCNPCMKKNWRRIRAPTRSTSRTTTWTRCAASPKATGSPPASSNRTRNLNGHISN